MVMQRRNKPLRSPERPSSQTTTIAGAALSGASDRTAIYALAGVIAAATIAFIGSQWAARTAFDAQMVQIGVSILSADPSKSDIAPAREWAIALVEKHSGQEFSGEDRGNLWLHPIQTARSLGSMDFKREADEGERPILNRSIC